MLELDCDEETDGCPELVRSVSYDVYEEEYEEDGEDVMNGIYPYDAALSAWHLLSGDVKKRMSHRLKISDFWLHILLRKEDGHPTTLWAIITGFLDSNVKSDLSLQKLERIEILESILSAMERGWLSDKLTKQLIPMSACFLLSGRDLTDKAMAWLAKTGEPDIVRKVHKLGPRFICFEVLRFIFGKYSPLTTQAVAGQGVLLTLKEDISLEPDSWSKEKSEHLKSKGNEQYRKNNFRLALKWYTKAIEHHPTNHVLYGNRAICFIRIAKYLKAVGDGKRAIVLKPDWAKGHYRFCEALFLLEQHKKALEANEMAHSLCHTDPEGIKDLQRQRVKFLSEMEDRKDEGKSGRPKKTGIMKISHKRSHSGFATSTEPQCDPEPGCELDQVDDDFTEEKVEGEDQISSEVCPEEADIRMHNKDNEETKQMKRDMKERKLPRAEKLNIKSTHSAVEKETETLKSAATLREELACAVQDAHMALTEEHWFNAKQSFFRALDILDSTSPQELSVSELDKLLLVYGYGTALLEIGQPQELAEATKQFVQMQSCCDGKLEHLVYYGMGRVKLKENRFSEALKQFSEALLLCERKSNPGELTWPTTNVPVKDAQIEHLLDLLEEAIETCRFPPSPDAICRHKINEDHLKKEIYYTDPGFKGFHRIECSQRCVVEFHTSCWKKFKTATFPDKTDKDFLQKNCFTPDCIGRVCHVVIVGSTGHIKCEFESAIPKQTLQRSKIKQRSTCLKVSKIKEDQKVKRNRQAASVTLADDSFSDQTTSIAECAKKGTVHAWLYEDHVLRKIGEMRESFADENVDMSAFNTYLTDWIKRDIAKGLEHPTLNGEGLTDVVEMLLQRKNRVWARIFIQELSHFADLKPELLEWAQHLNSQGLKSAKTFIERYSESLEELDLGLLLKFPPLQDALIDTFGTMSDLLTSAELTITECLRQASPQKMRLFIWTLEEHRDEYPSCHTVLDEYFAMDCSYLVIKKTELESPAKQHPKKNKSKRKKLKEPKSVLVLSGMRSGALREEREDDYLYEEDSFMLLDDIDSFTIPDYLRDQVAEFEDECIGTVDAVHTRYPYHIPDPTRENLYDYFAQVLEEHGPLKTDHPLLVGELENFPPDALNTIEESGGLKAFLLQSIRFVIKDDVIALMKHAGVLQNETQEQISIFSDDNEPTLNPFAEEFYPTVSRTRNIASSEDSYNEAFGDSSCEPFTRPIQESSHSSFESPSELSGPLRHLEIYNSAFNISSIKQTGQCSSVNAVQDWKTELGDSFNEQGNGDGNSSQHGMAASNEQAVSLIGDEVAVNTEAYDDFEIMKGDMTKTENNYIKCKTKIPLLKKEVESKIQTRHTDLAQRNDVYKRICQQIEVINKELTVLQQKFDEEMKMYQPEKRENQETLKMLKAKISCSSATNDSVSKDIMEENKKYETKRTYFTKMRNQLSAEKTDLKGEIDMYKQLFARQTKRSQLAGVLIVESRQAQGLRKLKKFVVRGKAIIKRITELSYRHPSSVLEGLTDSWRACIQEAEQRISQTQARYREQMELVKNGTAQLSQLSQVSVPECPPTPSEPILATQPAVHHPGLRQIYSHQCGPTSFTNQQLDMSAEMSTHGTKAQNVIEKIADHLITMFPHFDRKTIIKFTHKVISSNGGHPWSISYEDTLQRVTQHILDLSEDEYVNKGQVNSTRHQASGLEAQSELGHVTSRPYSPLRCTGKAHSSYMQKNTSTLKPSTCRSDQTHSTSNQSGLFSANSERSQMESRPYSTMKPSEPSLPAWKCEAEQSQNSRRVLNMEDPCIICHEDVLPENLCVLECRHGFHNECIKSWLNTQSTCPTCRKHVLYSDDFPGLPVRFDK